MNGNPVILDHFAEPVEPIVWTIDTPHRCHRLGLLFELKVGKGKVMVCTTTCPSLQEKQPRNLLLKGIFEYMASDEFQPQTECGLEEFKSFLRGNDSGKKNSVHYGAGKGIGYGIAKTLAEEGYDLILHSRTRCREQKN